MNPTTLPRGDFLPVLKERGFFKQCTDEAALAELLAGEKVTGYIGFDPTADSLHIGSLLQIMLLVHLQRHGHRPIAIAGGGTALVGDPSGKTELRKLLTLEDIEANLTGIKAQIAHFVSFGDGPGDGLLLNNADWLVGWSYLDFLREVGRHFSVNVMLSRESVKQRLETGLSFIEFNYMILQAYDFMVLNRDHGCRLQMGGDDQWGNVVSGVDLTRRMNRQEVFGLTSPLITTATGAKMGKTAAGAVWLDERRTSSYDFHQYWINVDDRDVARFLGLYTLLPMDEVRRLGALQGADLREAKRVLAFEVTRTLHGEPAALAAEQAAAALFGGGGDAQGIPSSSRPATDLAGDGLPLIDALADAGLAASKGEARRLIRQGGIRVNGEAVADEMRALTAADVRDGRIALQAGKKRHHHVLIGD
ncbi:MAG: tyrosine--tRNA ligase [bacterium]|nr:tyrosine--tRNA ligase [bacterium]